jgi:hypothetical protein
MSPRQALRRAQPDPPPRRPSRRSAMPRLARDEIDCRSQAPVPMCTRSTRAASAPRLFVEPVSEPCAACKRALLRLGEPKPRLHALVQRASRASGRAAAAASRAQRLQPLAACPMLHQCCTGCAAALPFGAPPSAAAHAVAAPELRQRPSRSAPLSAAAVHRTLHASAGACLVGAPCAKS